MFFIAAARFICIVYSFCYRIICSYVLGCELLKSDVKNLSKMQQLRGCILLSVKECVFSVQLSNKTVVYFAIWVKLV